MVKILEFLPYLEKNQSEMEHLRFATMPKMKAKLKEYSRNFILQIQQYFEEMQMGTFEKGQAI